MSFKAEGELKLLQQFRQNEFLILNIISDIYGREPLTKKINHGADIKI